VKYNFYLYVLERHYSNVYIMRKLGCSMVLIDSNNQDAEGREDLLILSD